MGNSKLLIGTALVLALGGMWAMQMSSNKETKTRLAALEARFGEGQALPVEAGGVDRPETAAGLVGFSERLTRLENMLSQVRTPASRVADAPRTNAQPRISEEDLAKLRSKLSDPAVAEKEKLQALRLLRRNKALTDETLQSALAWLQSSQDPGTRRDILQQLDGATNAALRQPLLDLATSSTDPKVRQQAVENLRDFVADPTVEKQLWAMMQNDPDGKIREQAEEALRKGPMTPERAANLQQRASNPETPMDQRLTAMLALQKGGVDVADTATAIAELAQTTQDVVTRSEIFRALDGIHDPRLLPALLGGVQDPSPEVRKEATEALSGFGSNPNIRPWLEYVAQSDTDPRVQREAYQALKKLQKGPR